MKQPFPSGYYASACVINQAAWESDDWIKAINSIQTNEIRIGASRLVDAGWSIKLLAADSLALQKATGLLRKILARFFPSANHHSRIFGFD